MMLCLQKYVLNRLVRGSGASITSGKIGFFTVLSSFLAEFRGSFTCSEIFAAMDRELKVTNNAKNKETSDAIVGRVLIINAMIRQKMFNEKTIEDLRTALQIVVEASKKKSYHSKLAFNCLTSLVQSSISEREIQLALIPVIRSDLKLTWAEHSMSSLQFMIEFKTKFPKLATDKFLKDSFSFAELLSSDNFEHIYRVFWQEQTESSIMQPSYESFAKYVAKSQNMVKFCTYVVKKQDEYKSSRSKEVITLKVLTDVVNNVTDLGSVPKILINKYWTAIFTTARRLKQSDDILKAVYLEFFEAIFNCISKAEANLQFSLVRTLLINPGNMNVDKYNVTNRIVARSIPVLQEGSLVKLIQLMERVITDEEPKDSKNPESHWLYTEKVTALGVMQKALTSKKLSLENRTQVLTWLADAALFEHADYQKELSEQIQRLLYRTLEAPFLKINDEKQLLANLMAHVEKKRKGNNTLRQPLDKPNSKLWTDVMKEIKKEDDNKNVVMFHVLLQHMAMQLFNDAEMAANAIKDLYSCMERATTTSKKQKKTHNAKSSDEPEWTEVMVDLILHLLSQNSTILRNVIRKIFPYICDQLNLNGVHQILGLLDLNEENPLQSDEKPAENGEDEVQNGKDEDESDGDESESDSDEDSDDAKGDEDDDNDDDDDMDQDEIEDEDGDATVSDQLRSAVTQALIANLRDDDVVSKDSLLKWQPNLIIVLFSFQDSVDLDDMTEEEGQRLDEALSAAFQSRKNSSDKKKDKVETTALIHFRNRVIDLLIIYLKSSPELVVVLEILTVLYKMLDHYDDDDGMDVLFHKVQEAIEVATSTKIGAALPSANDLTAYLRSFIRKCDNPKGVDVRSVALQKIIRFITHISTKIPISDTATDVGTVCDVINEELKAFLTHRNPNVGLNVFAHILDSNWADIWNLLPTIIEHGLDHENRAFKRSQSLELLKSFLKNTRFIKSSNEETTNTHFRQIAEALQTYGQKLQSKMSSKEFKTFIGVLIDLKIFHRKNTHIECHLKWEPLLEDVQTVRKNLNLDSTGQIVYVQFCKLFKCDAVKTNAPVSTTANGQQGEETVNGESRKRKQSSITNKKEKKVRKEKRIKMSSSGLDETIHFTELTGSTS